MRILNFILILILLTSASHAQFTYRGRVYKQITGETMTSGSVLVQTGKLRESRKGTKVTQLDSHGYFTVALMDSSNVRFYIDCGLEGYVIKTVSYEDTLILFPISVVCTDYNTERARIDIHKKEPCLFYNGTMEDLLESKSDSIFQIKYGVRYYVFTDEPQMMDCLRAYNREIKRYLDSMYGDSWRQEVKPIILTTY